jgi:hypothetical protein
MNTYHKVIANLIMYNTNLIAMATMSNNPEVMAGSDTIPTATGQPA